MLGCNVVTSRNINKNSSFNLCSGCAHGLFQIRLTFFVCEKMPVLIKSENSTMCPTVDVETLVNEVRERLSLKNREKFSSNRRAPYHFHHRSVVTDRQKKHFSSPESCIYKQKHNLVRSWEVKPSAKLRDSSGLENPRILLEKLLSEQSLIQEAVRRLQTQAAPNPAGKSFFHFVHDDPYDQFSNQTSLYSESEDDCVSQNSLDL